VECALVGNKVDLADKKVIDTEEGIALAKEFGMSFFETSAHTGLNIEETFLHIAKKIKDNQFPKEATEVQNGAKSSND
jgi:GTPase SAR1 family protein